MNCFIYTYGSHERGMGHIYQARALAEALEESSGAQVYFLSLDYPEGINKLREWGLEVIEIPHNFLVEEIVSYISREIESVEVDIAIVDILESNLPLMRFFADRADCLVSIDDIGEGRDYADLLINIIHRPQRQPQARYEEINDLNFVILRNAFQQAHKQDKSIPKRVGRILVSQGGSDTFGGIVELAKTLQHTPEDVQIVLLAGPAFQHDEQLHQALRQINRPFEILSDVKDMAGLMMDCDLAITGAGKTVFELAALGVPFLLVTEEPRELETAQIMAQNVLCEDLGLRKDAGPEIGRTVDQLIGDQAQRRAMSLSGKQVVDGKGACRSAEAILNKWQEKRERENLWN